MIFNYPLPRRWLCVALTAISSLYTVSALGDSADWYQVEVIIFSQQDLFQQENHRRDIELSFPLNSRYLIDPAAEESDNKPANESQSSAIASAVLNASQSPVALPDRPQEPAFVLLAEDLQQLGPDQYSLQRAPGYRVLFHEAWRQPGESFEQAPWLIIQGGKQYGEHFELEGAIRLVKSRYLHIQTNLWKTRFELESTEDYSPLQSAESISAPEQDWPVLPALPVRDSDTLQESEPLPEDEALTTATGGISDQTEPEPAPPALSAELPAPEAPEQVYNITDIVQLEQSLKLSLNKMGYLDHPELGVLVLVNRYKSGVEEAPEADLESPSEEDSR